MGGASLAPGYTHKAGHIQIAPGAMPISDIDWASVACPPDELFAEFLSPHLLQGVEARGRWPFTDIEFYLSTGSLPLHVDDLSPPGGLVMGMILECEADFVLTTGRSRVPARAGDVYLLDPFKRHGAETSGFYAFATLDVAPGADMCPERFRTFVINQLSVMIASLPIRQHCGKINWTRS